MEMRRLLKLDSRLIERFRKVLYKATVKRLREKFVETVRRPKTVNVMGFVERLDDGKINGWIAANHPEETFSISLGDGFMAVASERFERVDVTEAHPAAPADSGFALTLPEAVWHRAEHWDLSKFEVRYGATDIMVLPDMRAELARGWDFRDHHCALSLAESLALPDTGIAAEGRSAVFFQTGLRLSVIPDQLSSLKNVSVQFAGQSYAVQPVKDPNTDRILIDLPPFIWDQADEDGQCQISLKIGDTVLGYADVNIVAAMHMLDLMRLRPDAAISETLLAIEHARYLGKRFNFTGGLRHYLLAAAERYNCIEYLCEFFPSTDGGEFVDPDPVDPGDDAYIEAHNALARQLHADGQMSLAMITDMVQSHGLDKVRGDSLFESFICHFCETGQFDLIVDHMDEDRLSDLSSSTNAYHMTLALPFLVARGQLELSSALLWRLPSAQGWVNFECIMAASRHLAHSDHAMSDKTSFVYGLLNYIDSLKGNYWSGLYNRNIGRALEPWLAKLSLMPKWFGRDIVDGVLRTVTLSGDFWDIVPAFNRKDQQHVRLNQALCDYTTIAAINQGGRSRDGLIAALKAARALRLNGNVDADPVILELALYALAEHPDDEGLTDLVRGEIASLDNAAPLRALSHPVDNDYPAPYDNDGIADLVFEACERKNDQVIGEYSALQKITGRRLYELSKSAKPTETEVADLIAMAQQLNTPGGGWLAADIMLQLYARLEDRDATRQALLSAATQALIDALRDCPNPADYPAIHAAFAGLVAADGGIGSPSVRLLIDIMKSDNARHGAADIGLNTIINSISAGCKNNGIPGHGDTLVVIYSCCKYLDERIPKLRETWIADLKARNIPYIILVGDGDDKLEGDILQLDVADTYEALPIKTLKMIDWVYSNTDFQYLVKIDDDCYLSAKQFFESQSYRKANYYGRIIFRGDGATNRTWHHAKSDSFVARHCLDRSPEPSRYCDGGSGYSLSRLAMRSALDAADSEAGRWLVSVSYFEDKLLGDLLEMAAIRPNNEDYLVHVRRSPGDKQKPVTMFENVYFPSSASPVSLVHLDEVESLPDFHKINETDSLSPKRIWPTHYALKFGWNSNQLEYISPVDRLERLRMADIVVVAVMRNEMVMLPHFLKHYRSLGITSFLIADNLSDDGSREYLLAQDDVVVYSVDTEYSESHFGVDWQQALLGNHCVGKWVLVVDADEFVTYPGVKDRALNKITAQLDAEGFDCAQALLFDMYPDGELSECDFRDGQPFELAPYHDEPPVRPVTGGGVFSNAGQQFTNSLRHRLMPSNGLALFMANKYPLFRYNPMIRLSEGLHSVGNVRISPDSLTLAHFKYHRDFAKKIENEIKRAQHFGSAIEYKKYRAMLAETQGRLFDSQSSVPIDPDLRPGLKVEKLTDQKRSGSRAN